MLRSTRDDDARLAIHLAWKKRGTLYQRMIRRLLDAYAERRASQRTA